MPQFNFLSVSANSVTSISAEMDNDREVTEFKQRCLDYLNDVLKEIEAFGDAIYLLNDEHLTVLNIQTVEPLDVDQKAVDFGPRFFTPRFSLEQTRQRHPTF
jgi:hypothetical protein